MSWVRLIQSTASHNIHLRSVLMLSYQLCLRISNDLFPSRIPNKILCEIIDTHTLTHSLTHTQTHRHTHAPWRFMSDESGKHVTDLRSIGKLVVCFTLRPRNPSEISSGTHSAVGYVGPTTCLNHARKNIATPIRGIKHQRPPCRECTVYLDSVGYLLESAL
jgi:hypothetical protein